MAAEAFSYDVVPYHGYPRPQAHPWRMAAMSALFGVEAARPSRCRVLELGCGDGVNLLAMALQLPESEFSGVDLSRNAIEQAQDLARRTGAANVTFRCADLLDIAPDYGEYDFIIAHGVYSWIPADVRERMMEICRGSLAGNGVVYISFNTLPGWHYRKMFREMLLHHVGRFQSPRQRLEQGRWFLEFLRDHSKGGEEVRSLVASVCEELLKLHPGHLYHDEMEAVNYPVYFRDFIAQARRHRLDFLAPAGFSGLHADISPEADAKINELSGGDIVEREQYLDFLKLRVYREVLLCRSGLPGRGFRPERVASLYVASSAAPVPGEETKFRTPRGVTVSTNSPAVQDALTRLYSRWPAAVPVAGLPEECSADAEYLDVAFLRLAAVGAVQLYAEPPRLAAAPGPFPTAARLARVQAPESTSVANLIHGQIDLDDENARKLLTLCDGTRDRPALAGEMGIPEGSVDLMLNRMCRLALLEA